MFRSFLTIALLLIAQACLSDTNEYIGLWSNKNGKLGDLFLEVEPQGDHLLAKFSLISNGRSLGIYEARVANGYLHIDEHAIYKKMLYSKSNNQLITMGDSSVGAFHKVEKSSNSESSIADTLTAYFTNSQCTLEKAEYCVRRITSEKGLTIAHAETNKTLDSIQFNYALFKPLCFVIETASVKHGSQVALIVKENKDIKREMLLSTTCEQIQ